MQLSNILSTLILFTPALALPQPIAQDLHHLTPRAINPALVPDFGVKSNQTIANSADCKGIKNSRIPCQCPPNRQTFIKKLNQFVDQGNAFGTTVKFPSGNDTASQKQRTNALILTLQNLNNKGVGCPLVSTTFGSLPR
ncbi:hypothetical protein P280DRAFT_465585 [Massarina eburnea CBS 473.64]|uniref:Uncharacterized protein n=1 Tax=Massarina eburnea CBS 473.64 TaxID=1395130 RepID=A0A6A6SDJ1_9PLEO|nr:hypothetical protein P280DRAFT_465585 [Massarina eburnea CBS 473.64]